MHRLLFIAIGILLTFSACTPKTTQQITGTSIDKLSLKLSPPQKVTASDGVYSSHVLVYWEAVNQAEGYRVFRAEKDAPRTKKEITKKQQLDSWLSDYTAKTDKSYVYTIQAFARGTGSAPSAQDVGYLKKSENLVSTTTEDDTVLTSPAMPAFGISTDKTNYSPGDKIEVDYDLPKAIPYTSQLRFYLSEDLTFEWKDTYLSHTSPRTYTPDAKVAATIRVPIPSETPKGKYYLLAVYSLDGKVSSSVVVEKGVGIE